MNLLVPPLNLVTRCLGYLTECKAKGLLICPDWKSATFWPILFPKEENPVSVVTDYKIIPNDGNIFIAGSCKKLTFWSHKIQYVLVARMDGSWKEVNYACGGSPSCGPGIAKDVIVYL